MSARRHSAKTGKKPLSNRGMATSIQAGCDQFWIDRGIEPKQPLKSPLSHLGKKPKIDRSVK